MGLFSFGKSKPKGNTMVGITEVGKQEAQKYSSSGKPWVVLAALDDRSPQTIHQLAKETDLDYREVQGICEQLVRSGRARFMGVEG